MKNLIKNIFIGLLSIWFVLGLISFVGVPLALLVVMYALAYLAVPY